MSPIFLLAIITIIFIVVAIIYLLVLVNIYSIVPLGDLKTSKITSVINSLQVAFAVSVLGIILSLPALLSLFYIKGHRQRGWYLLYASLAATSLASSAFAVVALYTYSTNIMTSSNNTTLLGVAVGLLVLNLIGSLVMFLL